VISILQKNTDVAEADVTDADIFEAASIQRRNEIMDQIVEKSKKHKKGKKSLSLLELHQKKLKKKKKVRITTRNGTVCFSRRILAIGRATQRSDENVEIKST
jgi:hypothetical protein